MKLNFIVFVQVLVKAIALGVVIYAVLSKSAKAEDSSSLFSVENFYLNYRTYFPGSTEPIISSNGLPNREINKALSLNIDSNLLGVIYFNNKLESLYDSITDGHGGGLRAVGWELNTGIHLYQWLDIGFYHKDVHLINTPYQFGSTPNQNGIEIKIRFYSKDKKEVAF